MKKTAESGYSVAIQPICDRQFHHVADELLYRAYPGADSARIDDPLLATARACATAFYEVGLQALVGERCLFFNATAEWVANPDIMPLPTQRLVAEIPRHLLSEQDMLARFATLRAQGYRICVDDALLLSDGDAVLQAADFLKVDIRNEGANDWPARYRRDGLQLIATFVESRDQLEQARLAGFDMFQGYVFSPPNHVQPFNRRRSSNPAAEMQLLAELALTEPDYARLESLLAQHPHLCNLVFRQLNSAAHANLVRPISSLREAIQLLGTQRLTSMAAALSLSRNDPVQGLQLRQVVIRAGVCRQIARRLKDIDESTAFTLGLLSLIGQVEGESMQSLIGSIPLTDDVKQALLTREGSLGKLLLLVERFERGELERLSTRIIALLNEDYLAAVAWAEALLNKTR
ncbi:MAG: EAL and HDOD domain-containing protein [Pseudomonadota bacterium]